MICWYNISKMSILAIGKPKSVKPVVFFLPAATYWWRGSAPNFLPLQTKKKSPDSVMLPKRQQIRLSIFVEKSQVPSK